MGASALSGMLGGGAGAGGGMGGLDMQALQNMLGGMGGGMPAVQPVANPEEAYASQLTQLRACLLSHMAFCNICGLCNIHGLRVHAFGNLWLQGADWLLEYLQNLQVRCLAICLYQGDAESDFSEA